MDDQEEIRENITGVVTLNGKGLYYRTLNENPPEHPYESIRYFGYHPGLFFPVNGYFEVNFQAYPG